MTRSIKGVSLGGAIPVQFSILGYLFDEEARGKAIAVFAIANGVGLAFGQGLAGFMSPNFRLPFLIVSLPGFFIVALFVITTSEPKREQTEALLKGKNDELDEDDTITWDKFFAMFPIITLAIVQGLPGILPWGVAQIFLNDFFLVEGGRSTGVATLAVGVFGVGAGASTLIAGFFLDKCIKTNPKRLPLVCGISTFVAPFFLILVLRFVDELSGAGLMILTLLTGLTAGFAGIIIKGLILIPETREMLSHFRHCWMTLVEELDLIFFL